jgi:flagellar biosynthesis/type III secretory pathway protein FliH
MSVERARILKAEAGPGANANAARDETWPRGNGPYARRIPAAVVDASSEADRIMREALAAADGIVADARASVASLTEAARRQAGEQEVARIAAEHVALRIGEEQRAERDLDRTIEIAALLAERIIGEAITLEPSRIAALALVALQETRGARKMRIEACKDDLAALESILGGAGKSIAAIEVSEDLARGSLVVHTELGSIDARLAPQLNRLAEALREALRMKPGDRS